MEHRSIKVRGIVQGVGFRPFVWRLADAWKLVGNVRNCGPDVEIEVHGPSESIAPFLDDLRNPSLPRALVDHITCEPIPSPNHLPTAFEILDSAPRSISDPNLPPDIATCQACLVEMRNPDDRRYRYPFIQCNDCGPRFTIIESLPFDRVRTTMRNFPLCRSCEAEYRDPSNRRFHCQTIACPDCGPQLEWKTTGQLGIHAIDAAIEAIHRGKIIAIKGIGGFHLACDARNDQAVSRLRARKGRGDKPFAIMVRDPAIARNWVKGSDSAWQTLTDPVHPIAVMDRTNASPLSPLVAPGLDTLGVLLPYTPIHHLLMRNEQGPWVMTSGNRSDEPLAIENQDAESRLSGIADGFLVHNRPIIEACDDSVVRVRDELQQTLRRARGMVPSPVIFKSLPADPLRKDILATGSDLKGSFCIVQGDRAYVGSPFGDVAMRETLDALQRTQSRWEQWINASPSRIAVDLHPNYHASQWGSDRAMSIGHRPLRIQHHHAHLAALAAEHDWDPESPLLGFIFDGTGYGTDGTIWGGEAIVFQGRRFHRIASLEPVLLPGGDSAIRFPYRMALALLHHAGIEWTGKLPCVAQCESSHLDLLRTQLDRRVHCIGTTSTGRLFDGVASILGVRHAITYEAQAAIELEVLASRGAPIGDRDFGENEGSEPWDAHALNFPTAALIRHLVFHRERGVPVSNLAYRFHQLLARWIVHVASRYRETHGVKHIGLTGGVFQNELLSRLACSSLELSDFQVLTHQAWPCHDGSIALGQAWIACYLPDYPNGNLG